MINPRQLLAGNVPYLDSKTGEREPHQHHHHPLFTAAPVPGPGLEPLDV